MKKAHTQAGLVVYTTHEEKQCIQDTAKLSGKSMSKYLLGLHMDHIKSENPSTCPYCNGKDWHHSVECFVGTPPGSPTPPLVPHYNPVA